MLLRAPSLEKVREALARRSLAEFVKQMWPVIEPTTELVWNWHIDVICDHVQALVEGRLGRQNLVINVPPGSMKSTILSVALPAWKWTHDPSWRGLFISGNPEVALRDSMKCRDILDSEWYRTTFNPDWSFAKDQNAKSHYKNNKSGFRKAISAGSRITGERGDCIVVDDPNDAAEAFSKPARDQIIQWWDNAAANRLADMTTGFRIIIQQRLHEEDLTGHVMGSDRDFWEFLVIRQEWESPRPEDPDYHPTSLGFKDPRKEEGELFFPGRFPPDVVDGEKRRLGMVGYSGQHQQRATSASGNIFKRGHVQFFNPNFPPKFRRRFLSFDTAFKEREENDYSVGLEVGETATGLYILNRWKERASYPDLRVKLQTWGAAVRPHALLIEDKASGQSLIQDLQRSTKLPVVPVKVDNDKVTRANLCAPFWEAGKVFVPQGASWVDDFLEQLYGFPKMSHDDDVDAFTQMVLYTINNKGEWSLEGIGA